MSADSRGDSAQKACLRRIGDAYRLEPLATSPPRSPDHAGLFEVRSACGVFWVRPDGRAVPTQLYDNGADYFCNGLTRSLFDGKYGYVNARLETVVPARYDFAYPFQGGHGAVCDDCTFSSDGEHTTVACARCGAVDRQGTLVLPLELSATQISERFPGSPETDCSPPPPSP
ncbi:MAG TPA: WG repeat-containing protein [Polyangiaceae bacterium]